jgi:hypothetical protein
MGVTIGVQPTNNAGNDNQTGSEIDVPKGKTLAENLATYRDSHRKRRCKHRCNTHFGVR